MLLYRSARLARKALTLLHKADCHEKQLFSIMLPHLEVSAPGSSLVGRDERRRLCSRCSSSSSSLYGYALSPPPRVAHVHEHVTFGLYAPSHLRLLVCPCDKCRPRRETKVKMTSFKEVVFNTFYPNADAYKEHSFISQRTGIGGQLFFLHCL